MCMSTLITFHHVMPCFNLPCCMWLYAVGWSVFTAKWEWTSHLEVSGTPGRRDRLPYLRSNSKQSCRRPIQVTENWPWHCEMHCMTLQIFRSKSWLPHCTHICFCQESNPRISMYFSTLFLLLKTLSEFSKHWLPLLQLHRPFRSWVLPHSEGTQP